MVRGVGTGDEAAHGFQLDHRQLLLEGDDELDWFAGFETIRAPGKPKKLSLKAASLRLVEPRDNVGWAVTPVITASVTPIGRKVI